MRIADFEAHLTRCLPNPAPAAQERRFATELRIIAYLESCSVSEATAGIATVSWLDLAGTSAGLTDDLDTISWPARTGAALLGSPMRIPRIPPPAGSALDAFLPLLPFLFFSWSHIKPEATAPVHDPPALWAEVGSSLEGMSGIATSSPHQAVTRQTNPGAVRVLDCLTFDSCTHRPGGLRPPHALLNVSFS